MAIHKILGEPKETSTLGVWLAALTCEGLAAVVAYSFVDDCRIGFAKQQVALHAGPWVVGLIVALNLLAIGGGVLGGYFARKYRTGFPISMVPFITVGAFATASDSLKSSFSHNREMVVASSALSVFGAGIFIAFWLIVRSAVKRSGSY